MGGGWPLISIQFPPRVEVALQYNKQIKTCNPTPHLITLRWHASGGAEKERAENKQLAALVVAIPPASEHLADCGLAQRS